MSFLGSLKSAKTGDISKGLQELSADDRKKVFAALSCSAGDGDWGRLCDAGGLLIQGLGFRVSRQW